MPAPAPRDSKLNGDDIIGEILRNMEEGQFKVRYTVLVPYLYRVYLHQEEYEQLRPVVPHLVAEAKRALQEQLDRSNQRESGPALLKRIGINRKQTVEYKRLALDWAIEFVPDLEERLQPHEIEIYSELGEAPGQEFGVGTSTRRIVRSEGAVAKPSVPSPSAEVLDSDSGGETRQVSQPVHARIRYEDEQGSHEYQMSKDLVVIGRGGRTYWVDLKLEAPTDVSREHCRLRRDPATGRYYLKDVSQFGTTIDGQRIPSSVAVTDGQEQDLGRESPLPAKARIGLADVIYLEFESVA